MLKEKKEYSRSIRMTQTIKNYVEQTEGNGFNDKLEKLVLKCQEAEPELDKRLNQKKRRAGLSESGNHKTQKLFTSTGFFKMEYREMYPAIPR